MEAAPALSRLGFKAHTAARHYEFGLGAKACNWLYLCTRGLRLIVLAVCNIRMTCGGSLLQVRIPIR